MIYFNFLTLCLLFLYFLCLACYWNLKNKSFFTIPSSYFTCQFTCFKSVILLIYLDFLLFIKIFMYFHLKFIFLLEAAYYIVFQKSVSHSTSHIGYIGLLVPNSYKFYEVISLQEEKKDKLALFRGWPLGMGCCLYLFII